MKKLCLVVAIAAICISFGARSVTAQGPQGVGASVAAGSTRSDSSHASHSMNPIKWVKKSPKTTSNHLDAGSDRDKKLTAKYQAQGLLPANTDLKSACQNFKSTDACIAALHVSHNLGLDFNCLKSNVTGVQTSADMSGCKGTPGTKIMSLHGAIRAMKPEANAKAEAKNAENQAREDLKEAGA